MSTMDIFNSADNIKDFITEENKEHLLIILEAFKKGNFSDVLLRTKHFRKKHEVNESLSRSLSLFEATCYSQTGEVKKAADIITTLYRDSSEKLVDDLIIYGTIAYMSDYKLSRRIMSDAVKQIDKEEPFDQLKAARAYLLLGQTEEKLEKFVRAIKYYSQSLTYFQEAKEQDQQMILFLLFKLGELHSLIKETENAIAYFEKTIELADTENNIKIKLNSLVSIAKLYGNKEEFAKAIGYLEEAIPGFPDSTLFDKPIHAEAYTDMAYNYFAQSQFDEALPYYEKAIALQLKLPHYSARALGMIYMQYAYCLAQKKQPDQIVAGKNYDKAIEELEKTNDRELLEDALADTIAFFDKTGNKKKKRYYENKFVKLTNEKAHTH